MSAKFQPNAQTGTGAYSVPIKVPSGRGSFHPELALDYNSSSGNGPFGLGWSLSMPSVTRSVSRGLPNYDESDLFVLSGAEDLVFVGTRTSEEHGAVETRSSYRPRTEGLFARITHVVIAREGSEREDYWEVRSAAGLRSIYGIDDSSRLRDGAGSRIFGWLLSKTSDVFGNTTEFEYMRDDGSCPEEFLAREGQHRSPAEGSADVPSASLQLYLRAVRYMDYVHEGAGRFLYTIDFDYGDLDDDGNHSVGAVWDYRANDAFSSCRMGFEVRTTRQCRRIFVRLHEPDSSPRLVRTYEMDYEAAQGNGVSLLRRIELTGYGPRNPEDGVQGRESMPPLVFSYLGFWDGLSIGPLAAEADRGPLSSSLAGSEVRSAALPRVIAVDVRGDYPPSLLDPDTEPVDMSGFALPGVAQLSKDDHSYWENIGPHVAGTDGVSELQTCTPLPSAAVLTLQHRKCATSAASSVALGRSGTVLADMTGSGRADLVVATDSRATCFVAGPINSWSGPVEPCNMETGFNITDSDVRLMDVDCDGVLDALRLFGPGKVQPYLNRGKNGWEAQPVLSGPMVSFMDEKYVRLANVSGDGPLDILRFGESIAYWPHIGRGLFGSEVEFENAPRFTTAELGRLVLLDVDGDGYTDLVHIGSRSLTIWLNRSGNSLSEPFVIEGSAAVGAVASFESTAAQRSWSQHAGARIAIEMASFPPGTNVVRPVDLLGEGTAGLLWSADGSSPSHDADYWFLSFCGGRKPYLLGGVTNGVGSTTCIEYRPSSWFYLRDRAAGRPWRAPLPFPVQVVSNLTITDELTHTSLATRYTYHHGYYDAKEREFRGFACVEQVDTEGTDAPDQSDGGEGYASPPLLTKTWFHVGAVRAPTGEWGELDLESEYWSEDAGWIAAPRSARILPLGMVDSWSALRALRAHVLRTETYALDEKQVASRPYEVKEYQYSVRELAVEGSEKESFVSFPHLTSERVTQWERGTQPMHSFRFLADYDDYGHARLETRIAVPQGQDPRVHSSPSKRYLATCVKTDYAYRDDATHHIVDRVCRSTSFEVVDDGHLSVGELAAAVRKGDAELRPLDQCLRYYDGETAAGALYGTLGDFGALVRMESLVITPEQIKRAYGEDVPLCLSREKDGAGYPGEYIDSIEATGGYVWHEADASSYSLGGFYAADETRTYDFHGSVDPRGLVLVLTDACGGQTSYGYDPYKLMRTTEADAAGLVIESAFDYAAQRPDLVSDPNGARVAFKYGPLGMLESVARMGREGEPVGDDPHRPGTRFSHDLRAFSDPLNVWNPHGTGRPVSVRTTRSEVFTGQAGASGTVESIEYYDGFGRSVQSRLKAQDWGECAPSVVVSGWKDYDNKGNVVKQHDPFFSNGWEYETESKVGTATAFEYDALGRLVTRTNPDGSKRRDIKGTPTDLERPDKYDPSPWVDYRYDENDLAGVTSHSEAAGWRDCRGTPANLAYDALGRVSSLVSRDGGSTLAVRLAYDPMGRLLSATDALGRRAREFVYDSRGNVIASAGIDTGAHQVVRDARGNIVERRDGRGSAALLRYDLLGRLDRVWARDNGQDAFTLREFLEYGDGGTASQIAADRALAQSANCLGRLLRRFDEAGVVEFAYDFLGRVVEESRRLLSDEWMEAFAAESALPVDWSGLAGTPSAELAILEPQVLVTSLTYDALDRCIALTSPCDHLGERHEFVFSYDPRGFITGVALDGVTHVRGITRNARGQLVQKQLGEEILSEATYDPLTARLVGIRAAAGGGTGELLQEFAMSYDPVGNVVSSVDGLTPRVNWARAYTYDPLYRLTSSTGQVLAGEFGEAVGADSLPGQAESQARQVGVTVPRVSSSYRETYSYDAADNLVRMTRQSDLGECLDRQFGIGGLNPLEWHARCHSAVQDGAWPWEMVGNQVTCVGDADGTHRLTYDMNGNSISGWDSSVSVWDHLGRLRVFGLEDGTAIRYLYDSNGRRLKKLVSPKNGPKETTVYVSDLFERESSPQPSTRFMLTDGDGVTAIVTLGVVPYGPSSPAFVLRDHLGSHKILSSGDGSLIHTVEFSGFGETVPGGLEEKWPRFAGKERDIVSGRDYFGRRYYDSRVGRWLSPDPAALHAVGLCPDWELPLHAGRAGGERGQLGWRRATELPGTGGLSVLPRDGLNLYSYVRQNPTTNVDVLGLETKADAAADSKPSQLDDKPPKPPGLKEPSTEPNIDPHKEPHCDDRKLKEAFDTASTERDWKRANAQLDRCLAVELAEEKAKADAQAIDQKLLDDAAKTTAQEHAWNEQLGKSAAKTTLVFVGACLIAPFVVPGAGVASCILTTGGAAVLETPDLYQSYPTKP